MRPNRTHPALLAAVAAFLLPAAARAGVEIIPTEGRNVYRVQVAHSTGGAHLIVGATYDNRLCSWDECGAHRWDAALGGFGFDLACGDLDGDGRDEVIAAGADGRVYVFALDGKLRWKRDLGAPVYQVAVARLDGRSPVVLASGVTRELVAFSPEGERLAAAKLNGAGRMMRAGDFDGDGTDEVAVLPIRGQAQDVRFFKGPKLTQLKDALSSGAIPWDPVTRRSLDTGKSFRKGQQTWSGVSLKMANGTAADLNGDGTAELIYSPGVHALKGGLRQLFALPDTFKTVGYDSHYNIWVAD